MAKILIVDDEPMMVTLAERVLSQKYEVVTATNGRKALALYAREKPDLLLSDLVMPEISGFKLHRLLQERFNTQIPVVFMTAEEGEAIEIKGFDRGATDFVRKPFQPAVLLRRVDNILSNLDRIRGLTEEAATDRLTGFLNKGAVTDKLTQVCGFSKGILMVIDLDSFKLVNDLYGHEAGDNILCSFADIMRQNTRSADISGRIGGDEFVLFCMNTTDVAIVASICKRVNAQLVSRANELLGVEMNIPLGVSIGAAIVPDHGTDFATLFNLADAALYTVKQNGKHGYAVHQKADNADSEMSEFDLRALNKIFAERNLSDGAYCIGKEAFMQVYRFFLRYMRSYNESAYLLLLTLTPAALCTDFPSVSDYFGDIVGQSLRKSDILVRIKQNQYLLLLPHTTQLDFEPLVGRLLSSWDKVADAALLEVCYEAAPIGAIDAPLPAPKIACQTAMAAMPPAPI